MLTSCHIPADYVTTRSEQVGFFFSWGTWRYYMLPQFIIQALWVSELEKKSGISFKRAYQGGKSVQGKETIASSDIGNSEVIQQSSERKDDTPLLDEKELSIPHAVTNQQPATVAASA